MHTFVRANGWILQQPKSKNAARNMEPLEGGHWAGKTNDPQKESNLRGNFGRVPYASSPALALHPHSITHHESFEACDAERRALDGSVGFHRRRTGRFFDQSLLPEMITWRQTHARRNPVGYVFMRVLALKPKS